jgi:YcxB-like protein
MIVKTKKYQLDTNTFLKLGMFYILREWWWVWFIPAAIWLIFIAFSLPWWGFFTALTLSILYILFWGVQYVGVTQLEQSKFLFEKLSYEIDSRKVLIKRNSKEGSELFWDQIKQVKQGKDYFLFVLSKVQFIYLPYQVFNSENEIRFLESVLKRKNLIKEGNLEKKNASTEVKLEEKK